jgi:HAE1 family hydrophobic/amphiphilic exporter-1
MAAQFESWLDPFIITFSIPFGIVGVIWGLFLTGSALGVMPFVGMIMVVGVVVNNAIVLVDYTNTLRARGVPLYDAILTSGRRRLRPILMTTLTTILGLIPLALARGEGSEFWNPMAIAVIGGLSLSTLVTLVFVPVSYYLIEERIKGRTFFGRVMK